MANGHPDTERTDSPLACLDNGLRVILFDTPDDITRALACETLPRRLRLRSVGSHTLAETTGGAHADACDLLQSQRVHDVADGGLRARH